MTQPSVSLGQIEAVSADLTGGIGIVGVGNIGAPIGLRLLELGADLSVFDNRPEACAPLAAEGAHPSGSIQEMAARSQTVLVTVLTDSQLVEVCQAICSQARSGAVIVVHSSVKPATVIDVARRAAEHDVWVVDAPLSGGPVSARAGTLTLMVGGAPTAIATALPRLSAYAAELFYVGDIGRAQVAKVVNNILFHVNHLIAFEAMGLSASAGIPEDLMVEIVRSGTGSSWAVENWGFLENQLRTHWLAGTPEMLDVVLKEARAGVEIARASGFDLPLTRRAVEVTENTLSERERREQ